MGVTKVVIRDRAIAQKQAAGLPGRTPNRAANSSIGPIDPARYGKLCATVILKLIESDDEFDRLVEAMEAIRLSRRRGRRRGVFRRVVTHHAHAGSQSDRARFGDAGVRQRNRRAGQHRGVSGSPCGMDLRAAVEPGPGGVAGASGRTTAAMQQPTIWRAGSGGKTCGAWPRISLRGEVLAFLRRRATA
jgi:hypothetical protein